MKKTIIISLYLLLHLSTQIVKGQSAEEYTLKASWIGNFARFIYWPSDNNLSPQSNTFIIMILGENPFGKILQKYYVDQKRSINKKNVEIKYVNTLDNIENCNILFISESMENKITDIVAKVKTKPVLMVADTHGFAKKGVHINFILDDDKLYFEINEQAVKQSNLKMDYELRVVAYKIIDPLK